VPGQRWQGRAKFEEVTHFAQQYSDVNDIRRIIEDNQAAVEWHYEDTEKAELHRNKTDDAIIIDFKDGGSAAGVNTDTTTPASKRDSVFVLSYPLNPTQFLFFEDDCL